MAIESREYQNFIIEKISSLVKDNHSVILELDCGMGKRVMMYRLLTETFKEKKVIVFLQTHSSLEETVLYLEREYGGIEKLAAIKSGTNANYRKYIIENNRVILSLPTVFSNTLKKYPELAKDIEFIIINEVDQIIRRVSHRRVLCVPWNMLLPALENSKVIGMSGTLRDDHVVLDEDQLKIRNELKTLLDFIPRSATITIEDFMDTDIKEYIQDTEVLINPVKDEKTATIINTITEHIKLTREEIIKEVGETSPKDLAKLRKDFFNNLPLIAVETELVENLNSLLLLRKYVYSMPASSYRNYLFRYDFEKKETFDLPEISGKELEIVKIAKEYQKITVLCSFLSTVDSLASLLEKEGFEIFIVTGRIKNKGEIIEAFKKSEKQSALILSPVGERDLDLPQTEVIIVFDLVNSPKTVYQKMKRGRGGKVVLLFYEDTSEKQKVKGVVDKIAIRYPWSLIFHVNKNKK
ncbi:MAG: DEAD/DEAH box helicase family protein [Candidatus Heimdallarchaeota archaeon]|nr:DEAD/DEAH box helicase family protein [Candidatus Heimdallarchaeota archaeon]